MSKSKPSTFLNHLQNLVFKFIIIGPTGVGKSCLLYQLTDKQFSSEHDVTIGVEFGTLHTTVDGHTIKLQIWDTGGQQSFKAITRSYYRGAQGIILVYDVTRRDSFSHLKSWLDECKLNADENVTILVVGNKCDLTEKRQVTEKEGKEFAEEHKLLFLESSAKTSENVERAFITTSALIYEKFKKGEIILDANESIKGESLRPTGTKKDKCCNS